ncbi:MAG: hypothetical protein KatS3mg129_0619 [Leptospiraceae bacterium]|nr:MAG: hypothetical protein KatS3mg129_0619 [Leptospiraceae bacterium]
MKNKKILLNYIYFIFIFLYLSSKLFFSFSWEIKANQENQILESSDQLSLSFTIEKGLIQKYQYENKIYKELYPEYLEKEHIPQRLFQNLSQDIKKNLLSIFIILFVDFMILLYLKSFYFKLTFSIPFRKILLIFILILFFINLYFVERTIVSEKFQFYQNYLFFLPVFIDSLIIFITTWYLFEPFNLPQKTSFLDFYFSSSFDFQNKIKQIFKSFKDLVIISFIAIFIVNLFLFPVYYTTNYF